MRTHRRLLRKTRLSTPTAAQPNFLQWLNAAVKDPRWRAVIRDRLVQAELTEIQF